MKNIFREYLREAIINESKLKVYRGSNTELKGILPIQMKNKDSDEQNGIGIFFSNNLEDTKKQGSNIYYIEIDTNKFINSEEKISSLGKDRTINLLRHLHNIDHEHLYYLIADYGFEISDPEDMTDLDIQKLYDLMKDEEIGTFLVDMSNMFGIETFVNTWNDTIKLDGVYTKLVDNHIWFGIINTNFKVNHIDNINNIKRR